jgi:DNA-binding transcriptional ArsR family regulator
MANNTATLDAVLGALADPTRRAVITRLGRGPGSVSDLARPFAMTLPSFVKHIRVLERSGLIRTTKEGRTRTCTLEHERLALVTGWLAQQSAIWEARTDRLEAFLADDQENR